MSTKKTKFAILGGGPGGIQLAYFLEQQSADYIVLEKADVPSSSFQLYPRHRTLISINKRFTGSSCPEFNMRHDWNSLLCHDDQFRFHNYDQNFFPGADSLVKYMADYVERFKIKIQYSFDTQSISKKDDLYCLVDQHGNEHLCQVLIVATGLEKPYIPEIEGIEHAKQYCDMSLDLQEFQDKRVLIIGKKNSAFETADHLISAASIIHLVSPNSVTMAWKSHYVGDLRAINNNFLDTYQLKSQNAVLDANIDKIVKEKDQYRVTFSYNHAEDEVEEIAYDTILCCTGWRFDVSIFDESIKPQLVRMDKFPDLTSSFESINNPGMFFAGTLTQSLNYRKTTSGFIHGFRYNSKALAIVLMEKYLGRDLPIQMVSGDSKALTDHMLGRVNRSGALWQQQAFIADAAIKKGNEFVYISELPKQFLIDRHGDGNVYILTLEFGVPIQGDPFKVERSPKAEDSTFLHPVIRHYINGNMVAKHHVIEDLEANWTLRERDYEPMIEFFNKQDQGAKAP